MKKKKFVLPTIAKMNEMGFQDGFTARKSREDEYLNRFSKKGINSEQIKSRVVSYCLGYKKGKLIMIYGAKNTKDVNGEISVNGKIVKLSDYKLSDIEEKIKESVELNLKKKRR
ncbi:MAG: hypothetical protein E7166_01890 [Firmicutes bacterium]|nr:hypothetical protein [Bacillota bacterium]